MDYLVLAIEVLTGVAIGLAIYDLAKSVIKSIYRRLTK